MSASDFIYQMWSDPDLASDTFRPCINESNGFVLVPFYTESPMNFINSYHTINSQIIQDARIDITHVSVFSRSRNNAIIEYGAASSPEISSRDMLHAIIIGLRMNGAMVHDVQ